MKKQLKTDLYGVIGLGRFGTALVQTLAEAGKEVIAIDKNEEKVKAVRRYTDYAFVVDNLSEDALKETGMQNCGTVTVCIGEQVDISILTTMLVIKLGVPQVIAKAASEVHGEGSTIEISCDGPLRTPYTCYLQGGVNFTAGRAAVLNAVQNAFFAD